LKKGVGLPLFNGSPVHPNAAIHCFIDTLFNNVMALQLHYANCEVREKTNKMQQLDVHF